MSTGITENNEIIKVDPETTELTVSPGSDVSVNQNLQQNSFETASDPTSAEDWQRFQRNANAFLKNFSQYATNFFTEYRTLLTGLAWIVLALISFKLLLTLVDAINDIPLLPGILELVGIGYVTWFVYRYMLSASSRQELSQQINRVKEEVLGDKAQMQLDQSLDRFQTESNKAQEQLTQDLNQLEATIETELQNELETSSETETMSNEQMPNSL